MAEQVPPENLEQMNKQMNGQDFWTEMPADAKELKKLMSTINFEVASDKKKANAAKEFISNYPTSMYGEFAEHFIK